MGGEVRVALRTDADLVNARAEGRAMAEELGFPRPDPTLIATAISEVARNIVSARRPRRDHPSASPGGRPLWPRRGSP